VSHKMRIRKGDTVHMLSGKDRGKEGRVIEAAPVPVAKVMLVCPTCNRPTRIGMTTKEVKGREVHVRVCKRADCGQEIDK
jgi:large subunit ribosomal protein L24